jgi:hypothetical protein
MPLQYDPNTSKITYEGREVGEYVYEEGKAHVRLNITYECDANYWVVPLSYFARGLSYLPQHQPEVMEKIAEISTSEESVVHIHAAMRLLTEKTVKRGSYVWVFHKSDADNWPSPLHGHDYEKKVKLDVLTGQIYDTATKQHCANLKKCDLENLRTELREAKDYIDKMNHYLPQHRTDI